MKIVCISDTHGKHKALDGFMPEGDVLVHAGDFTMDGNFKYVRLFNEWLGTLPYKYKLVIPGNHELTFDWHKNPMMHLEAARLMTNATLLNEQSAIIDGIKFYGSPITPYFCDWAFNRFRGAEIDAHWQKIPADTDVLITHGPPAGVLDRPGRYGDQVGCEMLAQHLIRVRPKLHVFGHIHTPGEEVDYGITFVNASIVNEAYQPIYLPRVIEIDTGI